MNEYPITINEFKLYFLREAGLEYQPFPNWDAETVYNTGDEVVHLVNFDPTVWKSLVDENTTEPGTDTTKWQKIPYDLDDCVLDLDIYRAMGEASYKYNESLFPEKKRKTIFLYLTMFFLVYDKQAAASGINGNSAAGPVIHRTVGKMSVSYMESTLFKSNPSYEFFASNEYGKKAYNLMAPYLRGGVRTFMGSNTGF